MDSEPGVFKQFNIRRKDIMNPILGKGLMFAGCTFMAFVYGAGAYSLAKGGCDMRNLKERMNYLEDRYMDLNIALNRAEDNIHMTNKLMLMHTEATLDAMKSCMDAYKDLREELHLDDTSDENGAEECCEEHVECPKSKKKSGSSSTKTE